MTMLQFDQTVSEVHLIDGGTFYRRSARITLAVEGVTIVFSGGTTGRFIPMSRISHVEFDVAQNVAATATVPTIGHEILVGQGYRVIDK